MEVAFYILLFMVIFGMTMLYLVGFRKLSETKMTMQMMDLIAKNLSLQALDNKRSLDEIMAKDESLQALMANNKVIYDNNVKILNKNATELYHVKESTVWLWTHYTKILNILEANISTGAIDGYAFEPTRLELLQSIGIVENYFIGMFKIHPKDYVIEKQTIKGTKRDGGILPIGEHGVN